jgi:hypothetical protein
MPEPKKGRIDVLTLFGGSSAEESEESSSDLCVKAMWKAIKKDDFDGFKEAVNELLSYKPDKADDEDLDD